MEWFHTDDYQICRKVGKTSYEFIEFNQVDDLMLSSTGIIDVTDYKDENGNWNNDADSVIRSYYRSIEELRKFVPPEDEDQIVAECLFECGSQFSTGSKTMSEEEAEQYLDDIVDGKIIIQCNFCKSCTKNIIFYV